MLYVLCWWDKGGMARLKTESLMGMQHNWTILISELTSYTPKYTFIYIFNHVMIC